MPTYQYECGVCSHSFEILQSMLDKKLKKCPECGQPTLHRLIGAGSGIIFKGSGFYETDYKKKVPSKGETDNNGPKITEKSAESKKESECALQKGSDNGKSGEPT
jgi:putative FmdB family regulatory protein